MQRDLCSFSPSAAEDSHRANEPWRGLKLCPLTCFRVWRHDKSLQRGGQGPSDTNADALEIISALVAYRPCESATFSQWEVPRNSGVSVSAVILLYLLKGSPLLIFLKLLRLYFNSISPFLPFPPSKHFTCSPLLPFKFMASLFPSCHCRHSLPCPFSVPNVHVFRADHLALGNQSCALPWRGPPLPFPVLLHRKMLILKIVFLFVCLCACVCVCVSM